MKRKLLQSSLALTAAAALGLGGAFAASPAMAADQAPAVNKTELNVQSDSGLQKVIGEELSEKDGKLKSEIGRFGVSGNTLHLGVSKETKDIKDLEKQYSNVDITVNSRYTAAEPQAKKDLVGGAGYIVNAPSNPDAAAICSTGFAGWDDAGNQVVLTAGHCAEDENTAEQNKILDLEKPSAAEAVGGEGAAAETGAPGTWGYHQFGSEIIPGETPEDPGTVKDLDKAIDFAVMKVNKGFTTKSEVTDWTTASDDDLSKNTTKIAKVGAVDKGAAIKKSGRTTGITEGTVTPDGPGGAFEYGNIGGMAVHGFEVTSGNEGRFSDHGDSGGAVYQGDTAVGVISGGPETGGWTWVADLEHSLEISGQSFNVEKPGDETPEPPKAPAAPVVKNQTIKPNGDVTGKAAPGADVKVKWDAATGTQAAKNDTKTVKANKNGVFTLEGPKAEGKYDYSAVAVVDGQNSKASDFTVTVKKEKTETPAPVKREISIDPKEIVASDFVKKDKAVTITVKGFDEGEKVTLKIASGPKNVEGITLKQTAKKDGVAAFAIYGTSASNPEAYLGNYDVSVTGANDTDDEKALTGSFKVVADEDGNGGGDGGDGGSDLPRTGTELTGLAAGAGLLVIGGAAVVLTMRRKKN